MADVIVTVPVSAGEEDRLFGRFVDSFAESRQTQCGSTADDAPVIMIRTDPVLGDAVKVVILQEVGAASDFTRGWTQARRRGALGRA